MNIIKKYFIFTSLACSLSAAQVMPMTYVRAVPHAVKSVSRNSAYFTWKQLLHVSACIPQLKNILRPCAAFVGKPFEYELINAACRSDAGMVDYLLRIGVDANNKFSRVSIVPFIANFNIDRNTALHLATDIDVVKKLIAHGADINAFNVQKRRPLDLANDENMQEFLVERGAICNDAVKMNAILERLNRPKMLTFLLAKHPRLGNESIIQTVPENVLQDIWNSMCGVPAE